MSVKTKPRPPEQGGEFLQTMRRLLLEGRQPAEIRLCNKADLRTQFAEVTDVLLRQDEVRLVVAHNGLLGATGVLPKFVTDMLRKGQPGDGCELRSLIDRCTEQLLHAEHRAWERCHAIVAWERATAGGKDASRAGWLADLLRLYGPLELQAAPRESLVWLARYLLQPSRAPELLQNMLVEFFRLPIEVREPATPSDEVSAEAATDNEAADIRIVVGPASMADFRRFLPGGRGLAQLLELTSLFVGETCAFEVEPILRASDIPSNTFGNDDLRLGFTTWFPDLPDGSHVADKSIVIESRQCRRLLGAIGNREGGRDEAD